MERCRLQNRVNRSRISPDDDPAIGFEERPLGLYCSAYVHIET